MACLSELQDAGLMSRPVRSGRPPLVQLSEMLASGQEVLLHWDELKAGAPNAP